MGKKTQKNKDCSVELDELELQIYEAFLARGWIIPQTEADVSTAQSLSAKSRATLPSTLRDPYSVLRRSSEMKAKVVSLDRDDCHETPELLARAAREGNEIPEEIEERMRRDREAAEEKSANEQ